MPNKDGNLSELGSAALEYVRAGFAVFPLHGRSKTPMTKHGFKDWTDDPESVREIWTRYPNANIGIATGAPSGNLFVIDVDRDDAKGYDGDVFLRGWQREHGEFPETACEVTGRGGEHYFFRSDGRELRCGSNEDIHVDVRADGGFVMVAPSVHPNGNAMFWDLEPDCYPIADANESVYALVEEICGKSEEYVRVDASDEVKSGGRNNKLFKMACGLMSQSWDDGMIRDTIEGFNEKRCKPPLPKDEVDKILGSVLKLPKGKSEKFYEDKRNEAEKNQQRGRPRKFDHAAIAERLMKENGACFVDGMPAIRHGNMYRIGWQEIDKEIIGLDKNATRANQHEVHHYLTTMAPRVEQSRPTLIAFKNGILDLDTMQLRDWRKDDVIPNVIPHDWNENAEFDAVDELLLRVSCYEDDVMQSLIEVMGVCMYRSSEFAQSAILLGEGSNGKSTYIRMLTALLGKENISSLDMAMIGKQFHTGQIAGKLANLGDDISNEFQRGDLLTVFKKTVDGNRIFTDVKGTEGYSFEPYATLVFSANEFPRLADYTDGMMRRIFPIEFNARFSRNDPDYDPRIAKKVTGEAACERMCVLGVIGLKMAIAHNGFSPNAASTRRVEEILADNDVVLAWTIDQQRTADSLDGEIAQNAYDDFKEWCLDSGVQAVKRTKFTRAVNRNLGMRVEPTWINGATKRCFVKPKKS